MHLSPVAGASGSQALVPSRQAGTSLAPVSQPANLSNEAASTFQVLQGGAASPASGSPAFVLPADAAGFLRLYQALQAIAIERVYPAPIFSFQA